MLKKDKFNLTKNYLFQHLDVKKNFSKYTFLC